MKLKILTHDMFFITKRIKKINKNYFICFNKATHRFEVHFKGQDKNTFCFCVDGKLDARALKKTYLTLVKNAKKLFKEIDRNNKRVEEEKQRRTMEKHMSDFAFMLDYASRKAGDIDFKGMQDFKWI